MEIPIATLTIAGSDCSGGAGMQADSKVLQYHGIHALTAVTCVVSETSETVRAIHPVPTEILADQISLLLASFPVSSIKTGMLHSPEKIRTVSSLIARHPSIPLVVDPVMVASTGDSLMESDALTAYRSDLLPLATLGTPNLAEAEALLGKPIHDASEIEQAAFELSKLAGTSILLKGGHGTTSSSDDVLAHQGSIHWFRAPRLSSNCSHGTGCTLSAAIAARIALGDDLITAISRAKSFIHAAIAHGYRFPGTPGIHALNQGTHPFPGLRNIDQTANTPTQPDGRQPCDPAETDCRSQG